MMRDQMKKGDQAFFYHSNCDEPNIAGIVKIVREGYSDPTAFDLENKHYDPKSDPDNPCWYLVDVDYVRKTRRVITLAELKAAKALADMPLVRRCNRLSVMPVGEKEWYAILQME